MVEAALGLYNGAIVLLFPQMLRVNAAALALSMPLLGLNLAPALLGVAYLVVPTLLLGVTFPAARHANAAKCLKRNADDEFTTRCPYVSFADTRLTESLEYPPP